MFYIKFCRSSRKGRCPLCYEWNIVNGHSFKANSSRVPKLIKVQLNNEYLHFERRVNLKRPLHYNGYSNTSNIFKHISPSAILVNEKVWSKNVNSIRQYSKSSTKKPELNLDEESNLGTRRTRYIILGVATAAGISLAMFKFFYDMARKDEEKIKELKALSSSPKEAVISPKSSVQIPESVKYLIIGGGTAAFSASRSIKSNDAKAKILIINQENNYPYMRPPLSKELLRMEDRYTAKSLQFLQWNGSLRSVFYEPEEFFVSCEELNSNENGGIAVARGWKVASLDVQQRTVTLEDGKKIRYGKCLLATGSIPVELPLIERLPFKTKTQISYFHTTHDYKKLDSVLSNGAKSVAVYGSDLLACELACSIKIRGEDSGVKVTQIFGNIDILIDKFPIYIRSWIKEKMAHEEINLIKKYSIANISNRGDQLIIGLTNGKFVKADHLIICVGVTPNTNLGTKSGLEIDDLNGGYLVNPELEARSDLYAAGDCASYYDVSLNKRRCVQQYDNAIVAGRIAGENMTGARKVMDHQVMFWSEFGSQVELEAVGNITTELRTVGFFTDSHEGEKALSKETDEEVQPPVKSLRLKAYNRGVIFYLNDEYILEGIILWNLPNRLATARQVLRNRIPVEDIREVAKLFSIYED